jgi:hypothetical protein
MTMRRRAAITMTVLVCSAAMSGCGSHHASGSVVGDYRVVGGPAPGVDHPLRGVIWAYRGRVTWDQSSHSTAVAHVRTDAGGRFDLRLPVGEFTLIGSQGASESLPPSGCGSPLVVHVHASKSQTVHLVCSVP